MVVGTRRTGQSISETADLPGVSPTSISTVIENGQNKRKYQLSSSSVGRKARGLRRMTTLVPADRKVTIPQITTGYNQSHAEEHL